MVDPWSSWQLGKLTVPNRIVRSATWEGMADDMGLPQPSMIETLGRLGAGGAGLVVLGFTAVDPRGKGLKAQSCLYSRESLGAFAPVARVIAAGGAKSAIQIGHCGGQLWSELIKSGGKAEGPSAVDENTEEMNSERLTQVVGAFAQAAGYAREAGFDAVQLHLAHGYLLSSFLSPNTNQRVDQWGGSLENRARFPAAVVAAVRARVGPDYPVWAKWNCADYFAGGLTMDDSLAAARIVTAAGLDALEISGGVKDSGELGTTRGPAAGPGYFLASAQEFARDLSLPVGTVGGFRDLVAVRDALEKGMAFVALSRPLIRNPELPAAWKSDAQTGDGCTSCNRCFIPGLRGKGIKCMGKRAR